MIRLGLEVWDSQANYLFFKGPAGLCESCLQRKLLLRSCGNYPGLTQEYYRIAVRKPQENDRLLEALGELLGKGSV